MLRVAERRHRVVRLDHGVYAFAGVPRDVQFHRAHAIALGGRWAMVTHRAAAADWELPGGEPGLVEVSVPRWRRARPTEWIIHESTDLTPGDRTTRHGLPITTVTRTLIDLGTWVHPTTVDAAVNDAVRRGLTTLDELATRRAELSRRGRNGVGVMRTTLESRAERSERSESVLENRAWRVLREGGLPQPRLQHEVWDRGSFVARLDGAYPEVLVGLEVDGHRYHGDLASQSRDRSRRNRLESIGWSIVNIDAEHLRASPMVVVMHVRRLCDTRARQLRIAWP